MITPKQRTQGETTAESDACSQNDPEAPDCCKRNLDGERGRKSKIALRLNTSLVNLLNFIPVHKRTVAATLDKNLQLLDIDSREHPEEITVMENEKRYAE